MNRSLVVLSIMNAIATGTPLIFASVGEVIAERSGVMNLALDGIMLIGAVTGFSVTNLTGNIWVGCVTAALAGMAAASLHGVLCIGLRVNQVLSGLAIGILCTGLSSYIGDASSPPLTGQAAKETFHAVIKTGPVRLPVVGPILFGQDPLVYFSWALVVCAAYYLFRTRPGLTTRAVGEDPAAADSAGVNVSRVRFLSVLFGGCMAGIGGAYFSLALVPQWQDGITSGAGWIALALTIFSRWNPLLVAIGAYVFGAVEGLSLTLEGLGVKVPPDLLAMLPYLLALIAVTAISTRGRVRRRLGAPAGLGLPYIRESR